MSLPYGVLASLFNNFVRFKASQEPERFDALVKAGFKFDRKGNLAHNIYVRNGGHYIDVGASKKIGDGLVGLNIWNE